YSAGPEAQQIAPEFVWLEGRAEILDAHLALRIDECGQLRMLDRAILLLRKEYSIAARYLTDRFERARQKAPPLGLRAPEFSIVLQHLRRVVLGIERDRNKGDFGAEHRPQGVLNVGHLLRQQRADVWAAGIDERDRHDLPAHIA